MVWVLSCAMVASVFLTWRVAIGARGSGGSAGPAGSMLEGPIALGAALGAMAAVPGATEGPWIALGGIVTIPVVSGAVGIGWMLWRARAGARWMSGGFALAMIGAVMGWMVLALTGGLGLAEGAAVGLMLGSIAWLRVPRGEALPGGKGLGVLVWGLVVCGVPALWVGAPAELVWGLALVGMVGVVVGSREGDPRMGAMMVGVVPISAMAVSSVVRVILVSVDAGLTVRELGGSWVFGAAEMAASRPRASMPVGLVPEWCAAVAAVGVWWCAGRMPSAARVAAGVGVGVMGVVVGVVALGW